MSCDRAVFEKRGVRRTFLSNHRQPLRRASAQRVKFENSLVPSLHVEGGFLRKRASRTATAAGLSQRVGEISAGDFLFWGLGSFGGVLP